MIKVFLGAYLISQCSYEYGYAAEYDGADLVADSLNTVIAVVIQYRLGAFGMHSTLRLAPFRHCLIRFTGFLSGNEVKARGALNAGLRKEAL